MKTGVSLHLTPNFQPAPENTPNEEFSVKYGTIIIIISMTLATFAMYTALQRIKKKLRQLQQHQLPLPKTRSSQRSGNQ